tara:strand:+ start:320 stop:1606 length:1287 start_codon:yes stop_codon:yes gene_type:complete
LRLFSALPISIIFTSSKSIFLNSSAFSSNATLEIQSRVVEDSYGLDLNDVNDFISIPSSTSVGGGNGTVEAWIKIPVSGAGYSLRGIAVKQFDYGIFLEDNILIAYNWNTGVLSSMGGTLNDNQWHHVAFTYQNGVSDGSYLYIDGIQVGLGQTWSSMNENSNLVIGAGAPDGSIQQLKGTIGEVRVWSTTRTASEILNNYNTCLTGLETGLDAWYKFSEGAGTLVQDHSTNSYDGTLTNGSAASWVAGNTINCAACAITNSTNINVTINTVDTSVTNSSPTLTSNATAGATYQWLDCNNNMSVITGETNASYTVTANGNYAVAVTENNCTDTSACISVTTVGVQNSTLNIQNLSIYPNPTKGLFTVGLNQLDDNASVVVYTVVGKEIVNQKLSTKQTVINLKEYNSGIYFVKITNGDNVITQRIVKQ